MKYCCYCKTEKDLSCFSGKTGTKGVGAYSKNGNNELSNLVWIDNTLNRLKGTQSVAVGLEKFKDYVRLIKTNEYC